jgi:hypothetical protein
MTFFFPTVNRSFQAITGRTKYGLLVMHELSVPLQGLFNFLIYRRQYVLRLKAQYPDLTWREILKEALVVSWFKNGAEQRGGISTSTHNTQQQRRRTSTSRGTLSRNSISRNSESALLTMESAPKRNLVDSCENFNHHNSTVSNHTTSYSYSQPAGGKVDSNSVDGIQDPSDDTVEKNDHNAPRSSMMAVVAHRISYAGEVNTGIRQENQGSAMVAHGEYSASSQASAPKPPVSQEYYCPLTRRLFQDPVIAPDGKSYERWAIEATGRYSRDQLYPNIALQAIIWDRLVSMSGVHKSIAPAEDQPSTHMASSWQYHDTAILAVAEGNVEKKEEVTATTGNDAIVDDCTADNVAASDEWESRPTHHATMASSRVTMTGEIKSAIPGPVASAGPEKSMATLQEAAMPRSMDFTVASLMTSTWGDNSLVEEEKREEDTPVTVEGKAAITAGGAFVASPKTAENDSIVTTGEEFRFSSSDSLDENCIDA